MYKVADLLDFLYNRTDESRFYKTIELYGKTLGYISLTPNVEQKIKEMAVTEFEFLSHGRHGICSIPDFVSDDPELHKFVVESILLSFKGEYVGYPIRCEVNLPPSQQVFGPIYFTYDHCITIMNEDGILENYLSDGSNTAYAFRRNTFERLNKLELDGKLRFSDILEDAYDRYENPYSMVVAGHVGLLKTPNAYWGEYLYYNPNFKDTIMVQLEGMWIKTDLKQMLKKAKGVIADELSMLKSVYLEK